MLPNGQQPLVLLRPRLRLQLQAPRLLIRPQRRHKGGGLLNGDKVLKDGVWMGIGEVRTALREASQRLTSLLHRHKGNPHGDTTRMNQSLILPFMHSQIHIRSNIAWQRFRASPRTVQRPCLGRCRSGRSGKSFAFPIWCGEWG